jgi:hypothetical protein
MNVALGQLNLPIIKGLDSNSNFENCPLFDVITILFNFLKVFAKVNQLDIKP